MALHWPILQTLTYNLHLESLNVLLVLLSVQMYTKKPTNESYIFDLFMTKMDRYVSDFVKYLLINTIQQMPSQQYHTSTSSLINDTTQSNNSIF